MKRLFLILIPIIVISYSSNPLMAQWIQTNGPENGSVNCFATIETSLFAGTSGGVYTSTIGADNWSQPKSGMWGRPISFFAVIGTDLFAATGTGISRSSNYGITWDSANIGGASDCISFLVVIDTLLFGSTFGGGLFRSSDRGANWIPLNIGLSVDSVSALAVNDTLLFAATWRDGVFRSNDYGASWTAIDTASSIDSISVIAVIDTHLFAGTRNSEMFRSSINGGPWIPIGEGMDLHVVTSFVSIDDHLFMGSWHGVFHSTDKGEHWVSVNPGLTYTSVSGLYVIGTDLYAGTVGGVLRSSNYGATWTEVNAGMKNAEVRALVLDETQLYAGTLAGIYRSSNGGENWNPILTNWSTFSLAISGSDIYAGGNSHVSYSWNGGMDWVSILFIDDTVGIGGINSLAKRGTYLFVGSQEGGLYRATHTGPSWWSYEQVGFADTVVNCLACDATHLYAGTEKGFFQSTNDGDTWTSINHGLTHQNVTTLAFNGSSLFAGTWGGGVFRSTNHDTNWTPISNGLTNQEILSFAISNDIIFTGTSSGGVFMSLNNGTNWKAVSNTIQYPPMQMPGIVHGLVSDDSYLFAGGRETGVWRRPWSEMITLVDASDYYPMTVGNYWIMSCDTLFGEYNPTIFRQDVEGIDLIPDDDYFRIKHSVINGFDWSSHFWFLVDSSGIVMKAQGDTSAVDSARIYDTPQLWMPNMMLNVGYTWKWDLPLLGYTYKHSVESISENVQVPAGEFDNCVLIRTIMTDTLGNTMEQDAYYAKNVGEVLLLDSRMGRFELIEYSLQTDVEYEEAINIPLQFSLKQNYPNPFNPVTKIKYSLPEPEHVLIEAYNILGEKIYTLLNNYMNAGHHEVEFNGQNLNSSVYFYILKAGEFQQVKKMVLLK